MEFLQKISGIGYDVAIGNNRLAVLNSFHFAIVGPFEQCVSISCQAGVLITVLEIPLNTTPLWLDTGSCHFGTGGGSCATTQADAIPSWLIVEIYMPE